MQISDEALHRHFYDKLSSTWATLICLDSTYRSGFPHWKIYGIHEVTLFLEEDILLEGFQYGWNIVREEQGWKLERASC